MLNNRLRVASLVLEVDLELLRLAGDRLTLEPFLTTAPADLRLQRVPRLPPDVPPLPGPLAMACRRSGSLLEVTLEDNPFSAEALVKVGFSVALDAQGGTLVHASAVAFGERTVVAVGRSGAGKSTLAGLCRDAGAEVLSDESVGLFADGRVFGSPFRSDQPLRSTRAAGTLALLLRLRHAETEALTDVPSHEAVSLLLHQTYRGGDGAPGDRFQILTRAAALVGAQPMRELAFRNTPEAARFVREQVARQRQAR